MTLAARPRFEPAAHPEELQSKPPFAPEAPLDAAARRHRARYMLAELLFECRPPWRQLEAEAVVDHREPAYRQRDALAIGA